ncbi:uncharacterized protein ASCRUDRAFT_6471 [Ascoidea rubescens DSM 1968]|uniref:Uncharacterized protein n=1 Tax=Ascoidea rubescens DSM 1968 TaxID=1344418 RepID=A0A1D2VMN5_9ASCO|nr:hypothetical protein ASCRUDRAFT_6471 [Ascoidea rubescens DSM 1968]ODV62827.1 hypothetical protein ASCRUDRAFT_6471 [Ascoidea rubescens DSM 1968]
MELRNEFSSKSGFTKITNPTCADTKPKCPSAVEATSIAAVAMGADQSTANSNKPTTAANASEYKSYNNPNEDDKYVEIS